ncbi:MAG: Transposase IS200-family protein [candidate division WWE3 bacterium GW2011_GWB1_44_4]|uniref:Transposase IS200-family protein n=1 Tax=candidate division WWE3 bacterium GW2011_GWB1_44_4 TaxID=1619116 RepID=A0A0G1MC40_UNCKA|nr:MAG: Transposase IS200-family protein [candidate division WWE3 bacterium GW2011_GWB1_44_4]
MQVTYSGHSVYHTVYHIVFVTKYRRKVLNPGFAKYAHTVIKEVAEKVDGVLIEELNIQVDHVHAVMVIPPRYAVSKVVEIVKSQSTKIIRKKYPWLDKVYFGTLSLWSVGYFVSSVGLNEVWKM